MSDDTPRGRFPNDDDTPRDETPTEAFNAHGNDTPTEAFDPNGGDAPTRRLPQQPDPTVRQPQQPEQPRPGSDAPTEFLGRVPSSGAAGYGAGQYNALPPQRAPQTAPRQTPPPMPPKKSKALPTILIVLGALLLIAIVVLLLVLNDRNSTPATVPTTTPSASSTPSASPTPSESPTPSPTPEPTEEPAPEVDELTFTSFTPADGSVIACPDEESVEPLTFTWSSTGAELAWFGTGVTNAKATPDASVDPTATYRDAEFDCSMESQIYTVTIDDGTGAITNNTVELLRGTP